MVRVRGRSNASFSTSQNDPDDPLSSVLQPPPDESPAEREDRIRAEREAKRVSDEIDDELRRERAALKKKRPVRVLLLGQSESGKSTTLKNFQIHYAPQSWREERACWRAVIQLNLIRSVSLVIDTVASAPPASSPDTAQSADPPAVVVERYANLLTRLAFIERILHRRLSPNDDDEPGDYRSFTAPEIPSPVIPASITTDTTPRPAPISPLLTRPSRQEFFVRTSGASWKTRFLRHLSSPSSPQSPSFPPNANPDSIIRPHSSHSVEYPARASIDFRGREATPLPNATLDEEPPSPTQLLYSASLEMKTLWGDKDIRAALDRAAGGVSTASRGSGLVSSEGGSIRVEDTPGFFLQDVDRIATRGYEPSDDDVIRARLRTMGVQEHRFTFERGVDSGREWRIFDVGGARSQAPSWLSFFDDMDAIIFLAPISCFDETLVEDRRVNRLEDSITLWRALCRSPLLSRVQLVLFLNKVDLLRRKIANGAHVARHVTSFGGRTNDVETVCKYFKQKFKEIQRQFSLQPRPYYVYFTSVTDTKATGVTLVREGILRSNLQKADFL